MLMLPVSGVTIPAIARRVVVFPEPDGPNKTVIPSSVLKDTSRVKLPLLSLQALFDRNLEYRFANI